MKSIRCFTRQFAIPEKTGDYFLRIHFLLSFSSDLTMQGLFIHDTQKATTHVICSKKINHRQISNKKKKQNKYTNYFLRICSTRWNCGGAYNINALISKKKNLVMIFIFSNTNAFKEGKKN